MKERPQNKYIVKYQFKPKYQPHDLEIIEDLLLKKTSWEDIFVVIKKAHPDVSPTSVWRWIEMVALKIGKEGM